MSTRWRIAAAVVAVAVFVLTLVRPGDNPIPLLSGYPPMVGTLAWAILAVIWVWFLEAVVAAIRRLVTAART
jgi:hypothetical protein